MPAVQINVVQKPAFHLFHVQSIMEGKRGKLALEEKERLLSELMAWVDERIDEGDVPRFRDVAEYAAENERFAPLSQKLIAARLRLNSSYKDSAAQQRGQRRSRKHRPIVANGLGQLHADLGFFSLSKEYETPKTFRSGFLVARDVLSRFVYAVPLRGAKSSKAILSAFETLFEEHEKKFGKEGHRISSVAFDKERGVTSKEMTQFFRERGVKFHAFSFSSSKAKQAENAIKQIRTTVKRLSQRKKEKRWWYLLGPAVRALNSRPIVVQGKNLGFAPRDVSLKNLQEFLGVLYNKVPYVYWSQFPVGVDHVKFKFRKGDEVRPKLIAISSAVLGTKRSEVALSDAVFVVEEPVAYVTSGLGVNQAYKCLLRDDPEVVEVFDESDLALSAPAQR